MTDPEQLLRDLVDATEPSDELINDSQTARTCHVCGVWVDMYEHQEHCVWAAAKRWCEETERANQEPYVPKPPSENLKRAVKRKR